MTKTTFPLSNLFKDQRIVTLSILFLLIFLLPVEVFPFSTQADSAPSFFTAISDMDGKIPLYWFKPGINPEEKIFDDGTKELQFYISDQWYENCAAEKFSSSLTPYVLLKSKIFISYQGKSGDTLYDAIDSSVSPKTKMTTENQDCHFLNRFMRKLQRMAHLKANGWKSSIIF